MFEGYLRYNGYRFLRYAGVLCLAAVGLYWWHEPVDQPNGGTWLGYLLGGISGGLVIWLAWLGIRKRQYNARTSNIRSWVSAHVYLGLSLLIVATLHAGFQFGWNVHTLTYVLMLGVIGSGVYGIVVYARYPAKMTRNRAGMSPEQMLAEIHDIDADVLALADTVGGKTQQIIARSVNRAQIGGGFWAQVKGIDNKKADATASLSEATRIERERATAKSAPETMSGNTSDTMVFMADQITKAAATEDDSTLTRSSIDLPKHVQTLEKIAPKLARKNALVQRLNSDITHRARMRVWLFFHIPMTAALLAALGIHVLSVFFYW